MATDVAGIPEFYRRLRIGNTGPDVAMVQTWLGGLRGKWPALERLAVDGKFGEKTKKNVELFQALNGLDSDGIVGRNTWNALYSRYIEENGAGEKYPGIPLRTGNSGAVVKSVQTKLKTLVPSLVADGIYGEKTRMAVMAFQSLQGLRMDGVVGPNTWESLEKNS